MTDFTNIQRTIYQGPLAAIPVDDNGNLATVFNIIFRNYPPESTGSLPCGVICDVARSDFRFPIRSIYVDNSQRWNPLYVLVPDTQQVIQVAAFDEVSKPIFTNSTYVIVFDGIDGGVINDNFVTVVLSSQTVSAYSRMSPGLARGSVGKNTTGDISLIGDFCHDLVIKPDRWAQAYISGAAGTFNQTLITGDANYPWFTLCGFQITVAGQTSAAGIGEIDVILNELLTGLALGREWSFRAAVSSNFNAATGMFGMQFPIQLQSSSQGIVCQVLSSANIISTRVTFDLSYAQTKRVP